MRTFTALLVLFFMTTCAISCKQKMGMTLDDFAKIESEINLPNPELDKQKVEQAAKNLGFTYQQYKDMFDKVEKDQKLKEQLGEIRLKSQKSGVK